MAGTSSAMTRFALLPGHDGFIFYSSTNVAVSATPAREVR
jgi:hypothetical protein